MVAQRPVHDTPSTAGRLQERTEPPLRGHACRRPFDSKPSRVWLPSTCSAAMSAASPSNRSRAGTNVPAGLPCGRSCVGTRSLPSAQATLPSEGASACHGPPSSFEDAAPSAAGKSRPQRSTCRPSAPSRTAEHGPPAPPRPLQSSPTSARPRPRKPGALDKHLSSTGDSAEPPTTKSPESNCSSWTAYFSANKATGPEAGLHANPRGRGNR
mmetsp:Transcript_17615/g.53213  ORF Transcript_17615/g.53213 Transcript_17615/m.53213 type:complete len:212 (-) Transcript_17615:247-882(-)